MPALPFVGLIFMLDSLFITNYFYIRSLRKKTDANTEHELAFGGRKRITSDRYGKIFLTLSEEQREKIRKSRMFKLIGCLKAYFLGMVHREKTKEKQFIDWDHIPYKKGIMSTAFLLILSGTLLTPDILKYFLRASNLKDNLKEMMTPDLCKTDDHIEKLIALNKTLEEEETNLPLARKQFTYYKEFVGFLKNDTSLYGVGEHSCPTIKEDVPDVNGDFRVVSGKKSDWSADPSAFPSSLYGTFFPGYCAGARVVALDNAKNTQCEEEYCECYKPLFGLCAKEVCVSVPYVCPSHTEEDEAEVEDYRKQQYDRFSSSEDSKVKFKTFDIPEVVESKVEEVVDRLLFQIDVASSTYVAYAALCLFFPTALIIFRRPFLPQIKDFLFGADRLHFVTVVVAVWWGANFFSNLYIQLRVYLNMDLLRNPCFADSDFLEARSSLITNKCHELREMTNEIASFNVTINNILEEVDIFDDACSCPFPFTYTRNLTVPNHVSFDTKNELYLNRFVAGDDGSNEMLWAPDPDVPFFGNSTICYNPSYAREYLKAPEEASVNFWDIWIKTGLLAMIMVKITIANFGIALMHFADPLGSCDGRYECPPERYDPAETEEDMQELKENMLSILTVIGGRRTFFWGLITNIGLFNMYISQLIALGGDISGMRVNEDEWAMFISFIGIGVVVPVLVFFRVGLYNISIGLCIRCCFGTPMNDGVLKIEVPSKKQSSSNGADTIVIEASPGEGNPKTTEVMNAQVIKIEVSSERNLNNDNDTDVIEIEVPPKERSDDTNIWKDEPSPAEQDRKGDVV